jgi:hypothetical protein
MTARIEDPAGRHPYRFGGRGGPGTGWRPRRLITLALVCLAAASLLCALLRPSGGADLESAPEAEPEPRRSSPPGDELLEAQDEVAPGRYLYALPLPALRGVPLDVQPGTVIELWVAWEPPLTDEPTVQKLLEGIRIHRIAAAVDPNAPDVALLDVAEKDVPDLIYGDRYGTLNATLAPSSTGH